MPVKRYGIYVAYPPTVDLRAEGLGRHLAMFLKGAERIPDITFTILCPSWTKEALELLFESEQVPSTAFRIVAPQGKPYALRAFEWLKRLRSRIEGRGWVASVSNWVRSRGKAFFRRWTSDAVAVHDLRSLLYFVTRSLGFGVALVPLTLLALPALFLLSLWKVIFLFFPTPIGSLVSAGSFVKVSVLRVLHSPQRSDFVVSLLDEMQKSEMVRMQEMQASLVDVRAWYCPTAFWSHFHELNAPRLMCVPDVVLADFPIGFSSVGGDRFLSIFEEIGRSIRAGDHFVTYSESVKWSTLVDRYAIPPSAISVIPHAPNTLDSFLEITGFPDLEATVRDYCESLLRSALLKGANREVTSGFQNVKVKFLFYASQVRPNKNVITLLRAYEYLLKSRDFRHKLIMTGHPADMPEIERFVTDSGLWCDVFFLNGLTVSELAACYKLADLAVNPTLSEGGCPFTFTEALSVGTPAVMSRISVAEEILVDPCCQEVTFFDPFSWRHCAERIEWAVENRDDLLTIQRRAYAQLTKRTWSDVVEDHIRVLDKIARKV